MIVRCWAGEPSVASFLAMDTNKTAMPGSLHERLVLARKYISKRSIYLDLFEPFQRTAHSMSLQGIPQSATVDRSIAYLQVMATSIATTGEQ